eukprot:CAMPEP_0179221166 /NCGR_PEP_ID=MMETSP0797-20121207/6037_1 /TAXON_ID=47934 /ORGANISM="Dinophysis acuminata, Strain DAEP01" /LENGTH=192 /DNA_ID=CAMNT_0020927913 /DNA_START=62 /DNA_END=636 /DNA_ORIENTATION=+
MTTFRPAAIVSAACLLSSVAAFRSVPPKLVGEDADEFTQGLVDSGVPGQLLSCGRLGLNASKIMEGLGEIVDRRLPDGYWTITKELGVLPESLVGCNPDVVATFGLLGTHLTQHFMQEGATKTIARVFSDQWKTIVGRATLATSAMWINSFRAAGDNIGKLLSLVNVGDPAAAENVAAALSAGILAALSAAH